MHVWWGTLYWARDWYIRVLRSRWSRYMVVVQVLIFYIVKLIWNLIRLSSLEERILWSFIWFSTRTLRDHLLLVQFFQYYLFSLSRSHKQNGWTRLSGRGYSHLRLMVANSRKTNLCSKSSGLSASTLTSTSFLCHWCNWCDMQCGCHRTTSVPRTQLLIISMQCVS